MKEGGKDDIDATGKRDIGGYGPENWYSLETEIRMGKEYVPMIDSSVKLVQDDSEHAKQHRRRIQVWWECYWPSA